ncbi:FAD-dependent thiol oxidase [Auriscalpium vulgare]|uniref:FAD-dependent thiol oxidase n=1 Tax=Auriscalpium vulgare TaxID=40419 RepID=A0ACB8RQE3_9AGAM|nr:FAD-dependent thiol oxidase [Auriscalpium vulgare]
MGEKPASQPSGSTPTSSKLPPGMVLGPDGKPCKICTSFRNWKPAKAALASSTAAAATLTTDTRAASVPTLAPLPDTRPAHCPPDVEGIGRATWTFLHTTAAYYPERPSPHQRANMLALLHALPVLYPCSHCAADLGAQMQGAPPDVSGRAGLSAWLCARHNEVNRKLGKEEFECAKVDERWKDGPEDGSCD